MTADKVKKKKKMKTKDKVMLIISIIMIIVAGLALAPATARTRILIRMTDLISATGWRTARRKCRRQEREHLSCPSLRRRSPRRMR